jgi:hypothetical protein
MVYVRPCCYCGENATVLDHVIPVSWASNRTRKGTNVNKKSCVGCCSECNSLLSNFYLHSIRERAEYLSDRIAIRYRKLLSMPAWSEEEQDDMGAGMSTYIKRTAVEKQIAIERLRHLNYIKSLDLTIDDYWDSVSE